MIRDQERELPVKKEFLTGRRCQLIGGTEGEIEPDDFNEMTETCGPTEPGFADTIQPPPLPSSTNGETTPNKGVPLGDELTGQPPSENNEQSITSFEGRRVIAGKRFDMRRVISLGSARSNDVTGQTTVADAIEYVRSDKSKGELSKARKFAEDVKTDLRILLDKYEKNGAFDLENTVCFKRLWRDQKTSLTQELTGLLKQKDRLDSPAFEKKLNATGYASGVGAAQFNGSGA